MSKKNSLQLSQDNLGGSESQYDVFQAISDPTRRHLLKLLAEADQEMSIATITKYFTISRSAVNKHLHILSEAGLVSSRKVGRETRYKIQLKPLAELKQWLSFFEQYWETKLSVLKEYLETEERET